MDISEHQWDSILQNALNQQLVPFLGAGASSSVLPTGGDLVNRLIERGGDEYPNAADRDLARVAQYYQVMGNGIDVREEIAAMLKARREKDFDSPPHKDLARLPVRLYLTTNYDDLMEYELRVAGKDPVSLYPIWHSDLKGISEHVLGKYKYEEIDPTAVRPIVYHLHGHWDVPESMVVTEDDYIQFLSVIQDHDLLPPVCKEALGISILLFVGYSLRDWNIRVLLLSRKLRRVISYAIMPRPNDVRLAKFLELDLDTRGVKTLWGTAQEFTNEFLQRWKILKSFDS